MRRPLLGFLNFLLLTLCFAVGVPLPGRAGAFVPRDGSQVLETLRSTAFDPAARALRASRARLAADPGNLDLACAVARAAIERCRTEADPRFLGRAQAALAPWWELPAPPVEVLVLRATLKQSQHYFTNALADLDLAVRLSPRNAQVWLTRAAILTVLGDCPAARRACVPLAQLAPGLVGLTAAANVGSLNGEAERSNALLRPALAANPAAPVPEKVWAWTILAEADARLGYLPEAETEFRNALALGQHDPYLLGAYADWLLAAGRAAEAVRLLQNEARADGLLLRLALAEDAVSPRPPGFADPIAALQARFEAGHLRGDFVHQREEAWFLLQLQHQPRAALRLATANWAIQHEPVDARLLLESALAVGDLPAAAPALEFLQATDLEDRECEKLVRQLHAL